MRYKWTYLHMNRNRVRDVENKLDGYQGEKKERNKFGD